MRDRYISRDAAGRIAEVRCKGCGTVLVQSGRPTARYAEMTVEMDDGARHVTPMCSRCAKRRNSDEELARLYSLDLAELAEEEKLHEGVQNPSSMATRRPLRSSRTFTFNRR